MNAHATRRRFPRAVDAIRTVRIARALHTITPEAATVRLTPVWTDRTGLPRMATVVVIEDEYGRAVGNQAAHRYARDVLHTSFSRADWTRQQRYTVRTGRLTPLATPFGASELTGGAR